MDFLHEVNLLKKIRHPHIVIHFNNKKIFIKILEDFIDGSHYSREFLGNYHRIYEE